MPDTETAAMQNTIEALKQKARDSWPGVEGERRAERLETFLQRLLPEYAEKLGLSQAEVLNALESGRSYSAINYYQAAKFPPLADVDVYDSQDDLKAAIPSMTFRCPCCEEVSTDPYECNSGANKKGSEEPCDWKAYGLFGTLGKGYRFTIKAGFLDNPRVDEIFMPVDMETTT